MRGLLRRSGPAPAPQASAPADYALQLLIEKRRHLWREHRATADAMAESLAAVGEGCVRLGEIKDALASIELAVWRLSGGSRE